jgi:hypothetical protein
MDFLKDSGSWRIQKGFEVFKVVERKCSNVGPQEDELSEEETDSQNSRWRICEVP